ncbi:MAG: Hsp20 family protein [Gammaproteobacteria bacterium]|nr:Hsp20 family protein [Gammaproteobacteria bacterium]
MRNTLVPAFVGFDDLFDRVFGNDFGSRSLADRKSSLFDTAYPRYNIIKNENGYTIELALAGFSKDDLSITVSHGILTVSGEKQTQTTNFLHQGISSKSFTRTFDLNSNLEVGEVTFTDGILAITLNKIEENEDLRKIEIK